MAKLIKETPILRGKDAIRFFQHMKKAETEKVSPEIKERIKASYNKLKSISKF